MISEGATTFQGRREWARHGARNHILDAYFVSINGLGAFYKKLSIMKSFIPFVTVGRTIIHNDLQFQQGVKDCKLAPDSISTHSPDFSQESRFSAFRKI
jgi:hypothetical protein